MYTDFENTILDLINRGYEGDYWDYKEEWHKDNERLIHDILCFSNTLHDRDSYIIMGVTDNGEIKGLTERKRQVDIIDLLRSIQFAGDTVPNILVKTLELQEGKEIDVLVIKNSIDVPYFIRKKNKKFNKLQEGIIYSRIGDSNTPINQNSSISIIESLWKKRFAFDKPVIERVTKYLADKENWSSNSDGYYHTLLPEYTVIMRDYEEGRSSMFYSALMTDTSINYINSSICYQGVQIHEFETASLDGGRYMSNTPEWGFIQYDKYGREYISYKYFIKETLDFNLHMFLYDEESEEAVFAKQNFSELVLYFESEDEKRSFEYFIKNKYLDIKDVISKRIDGNIGYYKEDRFKEDVISAIVLNEQLAVFRQK